MGYLASLGWEVCAIELHAVVSGARPGLSNLLELAEEAIAALDRQVVTIGHGLGGLVTLAIAERPAVAAAVALAPALPGFRSPLFSGLHNRFAMRLGGMLRPPSRRLLFELVADADQFHREALIGALTPGIPDAAREVEGGSVILSMAIGKPRLIVSGDSDKFAPLQEVERLAISLGTELAILKGRGHWLIGGRALQRTVTEVQRFLIKALGRDLLLLYPNDAD
jgi:pimeloyl-ACP methyl ester carboxylesterase